MIIDGNRMVSVQRLIEYAGAFNEEIHEGVNPEYTRGQVELILDAAGVPHEEANRLAVENAIKFFRRAVRQTWSA